MAKVTQMGLGWENTSKEKGLCMKTIVLMIWIDYEIVTFLIF